MRDANEYYLGIYEAEQVRADRESEYRDEWIDDYKRRKRKEMGASYVAEALRETDDPRYAKLFEDMESSKFLSMGLQIDEIVSEYWDSVAAYEYDRSN